MSTATPRTDAHPTTHTITATQIATELGVNPSLVRRWFNTGQLPGRKLGGPPHGWTTTRAALDTFLTDRDIAARLDYTADQIATDTGVSITLVRTWFRHHGCPGQKASPLGRPGRGNWRTTRDDFHAWYREFLERTTAP